MRDGGAAMSRAELYTPDPHIGLEGPLQAEFNHDGWVCRLMRNFTVILRDGTVITVPRGFETDFASVPRFFWRLLPPRGKWSFAAAVHDFLYRVGLPGITRARADAIFLEVMQRCGVPKGHRWAMYVGVRVGGRRAWRGRR